jgi:CheY-like chemotaxis protein
MTDANVRPYPDAFEQQVQDCLTHLYDSAQLSQNDLVKRLIPNISGIERAQEFRRRIIDLVTSLAADSSLEMHSRQGRVYSILQLRYIEEQPHERVSNQLSLSERQYFREHRRAVQTMAALLWEQVNEGIGAAISVHSESQRVYTQTDSSHVDLDDLFGKAVELTHDMAAARNLSVLLNMPDRITAHNLNYPALRQLVVWLIFRLIIHSASGGELTIGSELSGSDLLVNLTLRGSITETDLLRSTLDEHETAVELREALQAHLSYRVEPDGIALTIVVPTKQDTILIIDDNPDAISLMQRHLGDVYQTVTTRQPSEGIRLARELQPMVIILDIMLPNTDGWEVLINLKKHPATTTIPVLVCSVLKTPDLAYSLGADGYLKKPPNPHELHEAIAQLKR